MTLGWAARGLFWFPSPSVAFFLLLLFLLLILLSPPPCQAHMINVEKLRQFWRRIVECDGVAGAIEQDDRATIPQVPRHIDGAIDFLWMSVERFRPSLGGPIVIHRRDPAVRPGRRQTRPVELGEMQRSRRGAGRQRHDVPRR